MYSHYCAAGKTKWNRPSGMTPDRPSTHKDWSPKEEKPTRSKKKEKKYSFHDIGNKPIPIVKRVDTADSIFPQKG